MFYMCTVKYAYRIFQYGGGGLHVLEFSEWYICLYIWFNPVVGPIPWGCSCGRGVFCGESGEPGETQKQATAAGKNAACPTTGMAERDKQKKVEI